MPDEYSPSSPPTTIRVLLADDHDILRQGLRLLLGMQAEIDVVGEARTGREAIEMVQALKPDVVVMDISMPDIDGLEACQHIRSLEPATQVLMLTMHESEEYFLKALRVGAAGYLVKKAAPTDLHMAISAVAHGGAFLYPGLAKALVRAYVEAPTTPNAAQPLQERAQRESLAQELRVLTPRELEVLTRIARGRSNHEIAQELVISEPTVRTHVANILSKLHLTDRTQAAIYALKQNLVPLKEALEKEEEPM